MVWLTCSNFEQTEFSIPMFCPVCCREFSSCFIFQYTAASLPASSLKRGISYTKCLAADVRFIVLPVRLREHPRLCNLCT